MKNIRNKRTVQKFWRTLSFYIMGCFTFFNNIVSAGQLTVSNIDDYVIPDGTGSYVHSPITVTEAPDEAVVTKIDYNFLIQHTDGRDLDIDLNDNTRTSERKSDLWRGADYSNGNDSGANPVKIGSITSGPLIGLPVNQTWYLAVADSFPNDTGYIDLWFITIYFDDDPTPPPFLNISSLTPSEISTTTAPFDATLELIGDNLNNVNRITFEWSGASSGADTWDHGGSDWNNKLTLNSNLSITLRPRVVETSPIWSGNTTWTVTLMDISGATISRSFTVTYAPPSETAPSFTTHPANQSVAVSQNASFTVAARGNPTPNFQWQRSSDGGASWHNLSNGNSYSGVTTATLTIGSSTAQMNGDRFRVRAGNGVQPDALSNSARLTVSTVSANGPVFGVDISSFGQQGTIQWNEVREARISLGGANHPITFAIIRASKGAGDSAGNCQFQDPQFANRAPSALNAGIRVGTYHVAAVVNPNGGTYLAKDEASFFVSVAGDYIQPGNLRPALDIEDHSCGNPRSIGWPALSDWVDKWMQEVLRQTGVVPIIYCSEPYKSGLGAELAGKYDLWVADWTYIPDTSPNTSPWTTSVLHQYSDSGDISGIGQVDLNAFHGTQEDFQAKLVIGSDVPPVKPVISVAVNGQASEPATRASFVITRSGVTTADLLVSFEILGSATESLDYQTLPRSVTIQAGSGSAFLAVVPSDDSEVEGNETVLLLPVGDAYTVDPDSAAGVELTIKDDDQPNQQPVAFDDSKETGIGTPITVRVADNDTDADGDDLTVIDASQGAHGSTTITSPTSVTYTPNSGFSGTDNFTYTVSDGRGGNSSATVTVLVTEITPVTVTHKAGSFNSPGNLTVSGQFIYPSDRQLYALGWRPSLPTGWTLNAAAGDGSPEIEQGEMVFVGSLTANPINFSFTVKVPSGESGQKAITGVVEYQLDGSINPTTTRATPDPLMVEPDPYHSADYRDPRWEIDGTEVNRVLSYWRASGYRVDIQGADGYAPNAGSTTGDRHAADYREPFWIVGGTEVNRVLSYWRAGGYRVDVQGSDGYAPESGTSTSASLGQKAELFGLAQSGVQITHEGPDTYSANTMIMIDNTFVYSGTLWSLLWRPSLPSGWELVSATGDGSPEMHAGEIVCVGNVPSSPINMVYNVLIPEGEAGEKEIQAEVEYQLSGMVNPTTAAAVPTSYVVDDGPTFHDEIPLPNIGNGPKLTASILTDGQIQITFSAQEGTSYQILHSTSLRNWEVLKIVVASGSTVTIQDIQDSTPVGIQQRFYRISSP